MPIRGPAADGQMRARGPLTAALACLVTFSVALAAPPPRSQLPSQEEMQRQMLQMMGKSPAPTAAPDDAVQVVIQAGHAAALTAVAVGGDGRFIVSGSMDESVKIWDVASGAEVRTFAGQGLLWPTAVAISAAGERVLVSDIDSVRAYDTKSGVELLHVVSGDWPMLLSADGTRFAGRSRAAGAHELAVYDASSGHALWVVPAPIGAHAIAFSRDGHVLATLLRTHGSRAAAGASDAAELDVWELDKHARRTHCALAVAPSTFTTGGALSADGQTLVLENAARDLAIVRTDGCAIERTLATSARPTSGGTTTIALSPDGASILWATTGDQAELWPLAGGAPRAIEASAGGWSADNGTLVLGRGAGGAPRLLTLATGAETQLSAGAAEVADIATIPGGRAAVAAMQDGSARWWDLTTGEIVRAFACPGGGAASSVAASRTEAKLALGCADGSASLWDSASGARLQLPLEPLRGEFVPVIVRFGADGRTLIAARRDEISVWDTGSAHERRRITVPPAPAAAGPTAAPRYPEAEWIRTVAVHPDGHQIAVGQRGALTLWNLDSGELVRRLVGPGLGFPGMGGPAGAMGGPAAAIGARGNAFPSRGAMPGGNPFAALSALMPATGARDAAFSADGRWLLTVGTTGHQLWDVANGAPVREGTAGNAAPDPQQMMSMVVGMVAAQSGRGIAFSPDGHLAARGVGHVIRLWEPGTGRELGGLSAHGSDVTALAFSDDGAMLLSGGKDGALRVWRLADHQERVALTALGPRDFVAVTPDQYYRASKGHLQGVSFRIGGQLYPFEQFDLRFNRPDVVLERLGLATAEVMRSYQNAYQHRLKKLGFTADVLGKDFHLPEVSILTQPIPVSTAARTLTLHVRATDSAHPLDRFSAYVNDVPVYGAAGQPITAHGASAEADLTVPLAAGRNKVQVSVLNSEGVESLRQTVYTLATGPTPTADLWIVAVGVSHYQNSKYDLRFAAKDAADLVSMYAAHRPAGAAEGQVHVLALTDDKATREGVRAARAWLKDAHAEDMVVVFAAGHGMTDPDQNYFFGTYDINPDSPATHGLPFEDFESLLDGIAPLRKLLLVDTCFSGEIERDDATPVATSAADGQVTMRAFKDIRGIQTHADDAAGAAGPARPPAFARFQQDLFADLRRGTGAAVISSSSGNEFALEGEQWKNGVFTYVLLDGLKNGKADRNGDGIVTVSELEAYVIDAVRTLTQGKQNPTIRRENLDFDFPVY